MTPIEYLDPDTLTAHPLLARIPMLEKDTAEYRALHASIRERGIDYPILINSKKQIVDGRHRWRAALDEELGNVPTRLVANDEVVAIILDSVVGRRHFTKGARAYLLYPLFAMGASEATERRIANLKKGSENSPKPTQLASGIQGFVQTLGFSDELYRQAKEIHKLFASHLEVKREWEPRIISGELGLGAAIAGIAGQRSTKGKGRQDNGQLDLFLDGLRTLTIRLSKWDKFNSVKQRNLALEKLGEAVETWPEDIREFLKHKL